MAILSKQTGKSENGAISAMGASVAKTGGKGLSASQQTFSAAGSRQTGKSLSASQSLFGGILSKGRLLQILASMATFGNPFLTNDNAFWSGFSSVSSFSQSFTVRPDADYPCLVVDIITTGAQTVSSCTYNGVNVPLIQTSTQAPQSTTMTIWQGVLAGCAVGSNTLAVTLSTSQPASLGIRSFTGVDQVNPVNFHGFSASPSTDIGVVTAFDGCWVIDCVAGAASIALLNLTPSSPQVLDGKSTSSKIGGGISHNGPVTAGNTDDQWGFTAVGTSQGFTGAMALKAQNRNAISKQTNESLPGSMANFSAAVSKATAWHTLAASMSAFAGSLAKQTGVGLSAMMSNFAGAITAAASHIYFATFNATMSAFGGSDSKQSGKSAQGSMGSFAGSQSKQVGKSVPASMSPFTGSLGKQISRLLSAGMATFNVAFSAAMSGIQYFVTFAASMNPFSGSLAKQTGKGVSGSMATMGGTISSVVKKITGWISALFGFVLPPLICSYAAIVLAVIVVSGIETFPMLWEDGQTVPAIITTGGNVQLPMMSSGGVVQDFPGYGGNP